jgi:hypothetical protein
MRWSARRTLLGAAVLMAGILGLNRTSSEAADPMPESEFKALFDQDAKNIPGMIAMGQKKGAANISKASRAVNSNAMMIAYYANSRITGKDAKDDAKMAALRDTALKVALAAGKKKFDEAEGPAKKLSLSIAADGGDAKPLKTAALVDAGKMDLEQLMYQYKKTSVGGMGAEEDIKANSKKLTLAPDKVATLANRVLAVCEYCETVTPEFDAKKTKKDWERYNKDTRAAAQALLSAVAGKNQKTIQTALTKLDGACVACHEVMK